MQNDNLHSPRESTEIEWEVPAGILDLIALYESAEDIYIKATIVSSTMEPQITTGNSTNFPLQRGG
jgi:hypothetical protein